MSRNLLFLSTLLICLTLSACGGGASSDENATEQDISTDSGNNTDNSSDDSTSDDTTGDDSTGDDSTGDDSTGDDSTGDDSTGDDSTGDDSTGDDSTGDDTVELPVVSLEIVNAEAVEATGQVAKLKISRSGDLSQALTIQYTFIENEDTTLGLANTVDVTMTYSDGGVVSNSIVLPANQNIRVIEFTPVADELNEVPEFLNVSLAESEGYSLSSMSTQSLRIIDAPNTGDYAKVFVGTFMPQDGAQTSGSGVLSFVLAGDNNSGSLSYAFDNLTTPQQDQHIHLSPDGTMIKDITETGNISQYAWDLAPGGPFKTRQEMLDVLFSGAFFVNIHTTQYAAGEIMASMTYNADIEPPEEVTLTSEDVDRDIVRFLNQATFGAIPEDYDYLREQISASGDNRLLVYEAWIEQQFNLPASSMFELTDFTNELFRTAATDDKDEDGWDARRDTLWTMGTFSHDQLRQRMAFALSEILVVSDELKTTRQTYRGLSQYWDQLGENAFGTYRQALQDATLHPVMGFYLSALQNQKADEVAGTFPDENYAREIMQLFSFGLIHRQSNGAISLDENSLPRSTYDNTVIRDMARVFTGLSFSYKDSAGEKVENTKFLLGTKANAYQYRWTEPMKFFPEYHDFGEKTLFTVNGEAVTIATSSEQTEAAAMTELNAVLDAIVSHPSTAPYICRQLIQRLVTSNPSGDYIQRVVTAFGETGDMRATVKAILLDSEARNPASLLSNTSGKMREPIIQLIANFRLLGGSSPILLGDGDNGANYPNADRYREGATILRVGNLDIGQRQLGADSVFNFFSPDYSPTGDLASSSLVSPELQLLTETQVITNYNFYHSLLANGVLRAGAHKRSDYEPQDILVTLNPSALTALYQSTDGDTQTKAEAVVDYLDFYLTAGRIKARGETVVRNAVIEAIVNGDEDDKAELAIYGVNTLPDFLVTQ